MLAYFEHFPYPPEPKLVNPVPLWYFTDQGGTRRVPNTAWEMESWVIIYHTSTCPTPPQGGRLVLHVARVPLVRHMAMHSLSCELFKGQPGGLLQGFGEGLGTKSTWSQWRCSPIRC